LGLSPYSQPELDYIRGQMEKEVRWFSDRGIQFYVAVCPYKESVYPEYLPWSNKPVGPNRTDQYLECLRTVPGLHVIDFRPAVWEAKAKQVLYFQKDVHWNAYGGFVAYQHLFRDLSRLYPGGTPLTDEDLRITSVNRKQTGGIYGMVGMLNVSGVYDYLDLKVDTLKAPSPCFPHVLVLHDSMFDAIEPFFRPACSRFTYVHYNWLPISQHYAAIETAKPDVVIYAIAENRLFRHQDK
jgi:alginate O-acetyltransferase complex protein AlgJ